VGFNRMELSFPKGQRKPFSSDLGTASLSWRWERGRDTEIECASDQCTGQLTSWCGRKLSYTCKVQSPEGWWTFFISDIEFYIQLCSEYWLDHCRLTVNLCFLSPFLAIVEHDRILEGTYLCFMAYVSMNLDHQCRKEMCISSWF
jgi:hypothetical protein